MDGMLAPSTPDLIVGVIITALVWIGIPVGLFVFARRALRALERRSVSQSELAAASERLLRVEERVEQVADDNERLAEGQRFTTDILSGRARPKL